MEICYDGGPNGASCFHTQSDKERDIEPVQWDELRFGWGCMSQEDIGATKAIIEKLCRETKLCDREFKAKAQTFFKKTEAIQRRLTSCDDCEAH